MAKSQKENPNGDQVGGWVYFSFYQLGVFGYLEFLTFFEPSPGDSVPSRSLGLLEAAPRWYGALGLTCFAGPGNPGFWKLFLLSQWLNFLGGWFSH